MYFRLRVDARGCVRERYTSCGYIVLLSTVGKGAYLRRCVGGGFAFVGVGLWASARVGFLSACLCMY